MRLNFRFSLGWLFAFIALVAVSLAIFLRPAMIRIHARQRITQLGGTFDNYDSGNWYWQLARKILGPQAEPLNGITLSGPHIGDDDLRFLPKIPELMDLSLRFTNVTDEVLAPTIHNIEYLSHVNFDFTLAGDETARAVLNRGDHRSVSMRQTNVSLAVAKEFDHTKLNPKLSEEFRQHLQVASKFVSIGDGGEAGVPKINVRYESGKSHEQQLDNATLEALRAIGAHTPNLSIEGTVSDEAKTVLSALSPKALSLTNADLGDLKWLCDFDSIQSLTIVNANIGELHVPEGLTSLVIQKTSFANMNAKSRGKQIERRMRFKSRDLRNLPSSITSLTCEEIGLSDDDLKHLSSLSQIKRLDLSGNPLTHEGIKELAHMQQLTTLFLPPMRLTDDALVQLSELKELGTLFVGLRSMTGEQLRSAVTKRMTSR